MRASRLGQIDEQRAPCTLRAFRDLVMAQPQGLSRDDVGDVTSLGVVVRVRHPFEQPLPEPHEVGGGRPEVAEQGQSQPQIMSGRSPPEKRRPFHGHRGRTRQRVVLPLVRGQGEAALELAAEPERVSLIGALVPEQLSTRLSGTPELAWARARPRPGPDRR